MKKYKIVLLKALCIAAVLIFGLSFAACSGATPPPKPSEPEDFEFKTADFIGVNGDRLVTDNAKGDEIVLRGTNAGGYLIVEQWMCAVQGSAATGYLDHKTTTDIFTKRFGAEKTVELWDHYRKNFWTETDFENCAKMGMNVIRLPFSYMSVDPDYNNVPRIDGQKYNFTLLDEFVATAEKYEMYTVLDLHGAYGSQNGKDHSGESIDDAAAVDFYENEEKMRKTTELWTAVAEHFNGNPAVAAYDILNEPGEHAGLTTTRHWDFFDRLYDAIRAVDREHVIVFESCWDGEHLPDPQKYGWNHNCMYEFHNYSGKSDAAENLASMQYKIAVVEAMKFNLPSYMGEFNCYESEESWRATLSLFNEKKWNYTSWTYKLNLRRPGEYRGWGIYYTDAAGVVPDVDSFDSIKAKWNRLKTDTKADGTYMTFESGKTLEEVMTEYCSAKLPENEE